MSEVTSRIDREELHRLLNTMTPLEQQAITTRTRISDIEAEAVSNRRYPRPVSEVAALLPPCDPVRFPRTTRPLPIVRATTQTDSLAVPTPKRAQSVADVRAMLDRGEEIAVPASPALSSQVIAALTTEEIAMLPLKLRESVAELPRGKNPPRIRRPSLICAEHIEVPVATPVAWPKLVASFAVAVLLGFCGVYMLATLIARA